jgi:hypothetical protein
MPRRTRQRRKPSGKAVTWVEHPMLLRLPPPITEHAPGPPWPTLDLLTDLRDSPEESRSLRTSLDRFTQEQDPLALMQAFVLSLNVGVYPPVAILHALAGAFQTVLTSNGDTRLDMVLGLSGEARGTGSSAMTKPRKLGTQFWLASTIYALITGYDLSVAEAAERVSLFLETHPSCERHTADGLIDRYSRAWKKEFHLDTLSPTDLLHPASWTPAFREVFLKQFPDPA